MKQHLLIFLAVIGAATILAALLYILIFGAFCDHQKYSCIDFGVRHYLLGAVLFVGACLVITAFKDEWK